MSIYNSCNFIGRITKDPELKKTDNNKEYVAFTLAVKRDYKDGSGNYGADFINCIAWGFRATFMAKYITTKDIIGLETTVVTSNYEKDGVTVYNTSFNVGTIQKIAGEKQAESTKEEQAVEQETNSDDRPF